MSTPNAPDSEDISHAAADHPVTHGHAANNSPDPITGEPGAHPVGVGVGALSAGVAGAAIGAIGGPIGVLIGAAIGAVAGGLAGKEVAASSEVPETFEPAASTQVDEPSLATSPDAPMPVTMGTAPGESFRAAAGSGFADDASLDTAAPSTLPPTPKADYEDDALPVTAAADMGVGALAASTGLQAPAVLENEPLAGTTMPANGEEAVRVAAYYHYLDRVRLGQGGDAVGDWLEAEHEMMLS